MPLLEFPAFVLLERLLSRVESEDPDLLPVCRWLMLGPLLGKLILPESEPSAADLTSLLRLLRDQEPPLLAFGEDLARASEHREAAWLELCVDRLLEQDDWQHPTQVLERPRPDPDKLLGACQARLKQTGEPLRERVEAVTVKVERAARIEAAARETRERMRRRRR